jgi:hypothetical protein
MLFSRLYQIFLSHMLFFPLYATTFDYQLYERLSFPSEGLFCRPNSEHRINILFSNLGRGPNCAIGLDCYGFKRPFALYKQLIIPFSILGGMIVDLSIVVPCYNEVENISKIQTELLPIIAELAQTHSVEIVFVDDGSADGTGKALKAAFPQGSQAGVEIKIECHPLNRGLGAAIRTGFTGLSHV